MNYQSHMQANGIEPPHHISYDEKFHRFSTGTKKKKNGWYIAFADESSIMYGDMINGKDLKFLWTSENSKPVTVQQKKEMENKREQARIQREKQRTRNGQRISRFYLSCQPSTTHAYLNKKQVAGYNIREYRSHKRHLLLIPMKNRDRQIVGMQIVYGNGNMFKRYAKGSTTKQVYFGIGTPDDTVYVTEGYATGATIHAATGKAVAIAFSTCNLLEVVSYMKKSFPNAKIIVAADNDRWTSVNTVKGKQENPGLFYAKRSAELTGCEYRLPQFMNLDSKPTDFNDLYSLEGAESVLMYLDKLTLNTELSTIPAIKPEIIEFDTFEPKFSDRPIDEQEKPIDRSNPHDAQFRCLGFDTDNYYFLPVKTNKIVNIGRGSMGSQTHLLAIASLDWWESVFFQGEKPNWAYATDYLMRHQERAGMFNVEKIRGRGAWFDNGRSVLHIGSKLIIDGVLMNIHEFKTNFIYELAPAIESNVGAVPATLDEATEVFKVFGGLNFDRAINGHFLAGWCFLAPICSALDWRPHIWLTGSKGTGKSWIQDDIINQLVGASAFKTQGNSTEAGIRQALKQDGRPVVFDEAESEDIAGRKRMQSVLELARQASSNSSSGITKGTAGGNAQVFFVRSMFMFGSISVSMSQAADESRISVLSLNKHSKEPSDIQRFHEYEKHVRALLTDEMTASMRARAYKMIPTVRHNAKIIARAIAERLGSQRMGDQYGALLAGALAYRSDDEVTLEQARMYVEKIDFSEAQEAEDVKDEERLLHAILQAQIRGEVDGLNYNRSIAEFVQTARGLGDGKPHTLESNKILERYGIKIDGDQILIANNNGEMKRLLSDTPWGSGWARLLVRIEGSTKPKTPIRFHGVQSRCTSIPLSCVFG